MEKLDKVIAGLECCLGSWDACFECYLDNCDGCRDQLNADALDVIRDLRKNIETLHRVNEEWRIEVARLHKRIDEARAAGMKLNGVAEKPGTNYQKITKMSPLQMVNWIYRTGTVCECCDRHGCCGIPEDEVTEEYCLEHILMWLGQQVEE